MSLEAISRNAVFEVELDTRRALIVDRVRAAEIEGLGGARFPTATKLLRAKNAVALIVNGMQSEPDNNSDIALLQRHTEATLAGVGLVASVCPVKTITLALPRGLDKKVTTATHAALQSELDWLNTLGGETRTARQVYLDSGHAIGEEHRLASLLGIIDLEPSEATTTTPLTEVSVLCLNLATCYAIGQAVYHGETLNRRMVTINGDAQWVEFATPIAALLDPAWVNGRHGGGENLDQCVDAGTFCITSPPPQPQAPCINCAACRTVCPAELLPDELFWATTKSALTAKSEQTIPRLEACIECGACNAVCPSGLHLTQQFRHAKQVTHEARELKAEALKAKARVNAREERLKRDAQEREQQRKDRVQGRSKTRIQEW